MKLFAEVPRVDRGPFSTGETSLSRPNLFPDCNKKNKNDEVASSSMAQETEASQSSASTAEIPSPPPAAGLGRENHGQEREQRLGEGKTPRKASEFS